MSTVYIYIYCICMLSHLYMIERKWRQNKPANHGSSLRTVIGKTSGDKHTEKVTHPLDTTLKHLIYLPSH